MKYKKPLIALTFALLLVSALICFLYAFKTADVEVTVTKTEVSDSSVEEGVLNSLNSLKGKCLPFLSEEKIVEAAKKGSPYAEVISVKKSYPNKIVVNVKERLETFFISSGENSVMTDENFHVLRATKENANRLDGNRNVEIILNPADVKEGSFAVGAAVTVNDGETAEALKTLIPLLKQNRKTIKSASITVRENGTYYRSVGLTFLEGAKFELAFISERALDKFNAAKQKYESLTDKSAGEFIVSVKDGEISIV